MQIFTQFTPSGRNALMFGSNRLSSHRYFDKDSSVREYPTAEKNLVAGRLLAKGSEKRAPNPTRANTFFNQAMTARDKEMAQHATLAVAEIFHDGFYSIEKNDDKALEILKEARVKAERVKDEKQRHWEIVQIGRQMLLNHDSQLSHKERSSIIMDLLAATRIQTTDPFLARFVAMTFAQIGAKPELIRDAVKVSLRNADAWNKQHDKANPDRSSRACFFDEETLQYAQNFALGLEGFPQDQKYARELLLTRAKSYMTPNPIAHLAMARIAHEDLGDKQLATEILNLALDKAKFKPLMSAAIIFASLGNKEKARELLKQAEKKIEPDYRNETLISLAQVYARDLNDTRKALSLLKKSDIRKIYKGFRSDYMLKAAEVYVAAGNRDKATQCMRIARKWEDWGGSGNPQKTRKKIAATYLDVFGNVKSALKQLEKTVVLAYRYICADSDMKGVLKILDRCPENEASGKLRASAQQIVDDVTRKSDIYYGPRGFESGRAVRNRLRYDGNDDE